MILRRLTHNLRTQNWTAIAIEFVLLILGVFFGILAANWNIERVERQETGRLLSQLDTELSLFITSFEKIEQYYGVSDRYATRALTGWKGVASVSDGEFVIAAYQASQINGIGQNGSVWAQIFGAENLRNVDDLALRSSLSQLMTFDYALVNLAAAASRYREEVRKIIPDSQQRAIRARCGDVQKPSGIELPATCDLQLPAAEAARTAAALRARPDLVRELNWHQAGIATQLQNIRALRDNAAEVSRGID